jgi:prevent-host-death family protein
MRTWSITEARANISKLVDEALTHGPQRIERRASERVVIVAESDWNRMVSQYPTLAEWILNSPLEPGDLPERRPARAIAKDVF